jgi:hypothetical protein
MHPYIAQNLAAARGKDLRTEAAEARRARLVRRARRDPWPGTAPALAARGRRPGAPRWA